MNILFVSNEHKNLSIIKRVIENIGYVDEVNEDEFCKADGDIYDVIFVTSNIVDMCSDISIPIVVVDKKIDGYYYLNTPYNVYELFSILHKIAGECLECSNSKAIVKEDNMFFEGRVLVADDQDINRELMSALLNKYGLDDIVFAKDGQEAIRKFKKDGDIDLVFMDINMPVLSGVGAFKNIRSFNKTTPIVALTANAMAGDKEKYLEIGFDEYMSKPFRQEELEIILGKFLNKKQEVEKKSMSEKKGSGVNSIIEKLRVRYIEELPAELQRLKRAIEKKDAKDIRAISHKIKGTSANLRMNKFSSIAKEMEQRSANGDVDMMTLFEKLEKEFEELKREYS